MTIAPAFLRLSEASDDEQKVVSGLLSRLQVVSAANDEAEKRYQGTWAAQQFGISIPPKMQSLRTVAGWCGTAVDVLEERLDWLGWSSDGDVFGLDDVYASNGLDVDSGLAHLDALIFGVSFVSVGSGRGGEPSPLVTPHSPKSMTGAWDRRARRLSSALAVGDRDEDGRIVDLTLYLPGETVTFGVRSGRWVPVDRDAHKLGRVPVVLVPNRSRASREVGRSEITEAVRYYGDAAARTLLGLEVNREFYNAPQRIGLNIDDSMFEDESGNRVSPWTSIQGRVWNIPPNGEGDPEPDVKQFNPASPAPYIDQVKGYAQLLAAEAGIPAAYLGFATDNPSSADAIRAGEARLVKRAERRQTVFGRSWLEVARLALLVRDGAVPESFDVAVSAKWRDAATPTRAAAADETTKYVAAGVLPPDSSVTYDRMGLSPAEQRQLRSDLRRSTGVSEMVTALSADADSGVPEVSAAAQSKEEADAMRSKFEALGVAIRAGVNPEDAARVLGLDGVTFTGATPVSLRLPESQAEDLEEK